MPQEVHIYIYTAARPSTHLPAPDGQPSLAIFWSRVVRKGGGILGNRGGQVPVLGRHVLQQEAVGRVALLLTPCLLCVHAGCVVEAGRDRGGGPWGPGERMCVLSWGHVL